MAGYDPEIFGGLAESSAGYDPDIFPPSQPVKLPKLSQKRGTGNDNLDRANAVGTGFNRGLTRLAGLPVDTTANVLDLVKAAVGAPYTAITGKAAPDWLQLGDRAKVVGSSEWMMDKARGIRGGQVMLDPQNPDLEGSGWQTAGSGLTAAIGAKSLPGLAGSAGLGAASSLAGQAVYDKTGSPELALLAAMLPAAGLQGAGELAKRGIRGGEAGRRQMEQRVADLRAAGIENPTLGLASGNRVIGGVENLLQSTPGAVGRMSRAREEAIAALQTRAEEAAALASPTRGAREAGQQVQSGIEAFRDRFRARQGQLYTELDNQIPGQTPTQVPSTTATLNRLTAAIPGAPSLSGVMRNGRLQNLSEALAADAAGGTLPYSAVRQTRTMVGDELSGSPLVSDVPRGQWKQVYGALSDDLRGAANQAGPDAQRAFNRANDYTRTGMERIDTLQGFANKKAPEQAFTALANTGKENVSVLRAVKKSLPDSARGAVAGTVIERLGKATPGQQNEAGNAWSAERFLTNYNRMTPEARRELFAGFRNADDVRANVEAIAKAAAMMREGGKLWNNPSGTAAALTARGVLAGGGLGYLVDPMVPLGTAAGLGTARAAASLVNSPRVRNAAMSQGQGLPGLLSREGLTAFGASGLLGLPQPAGLLSLDQPLLLEQPR